MKYAIEFIPSECNDRGDLLEMAPLRPENTNARYT
jgi:hypothetical protein